MDNFRWNVKNIKEGLDRFNRENGRYPTALEIDSATYLPSARQIQRRFGGLISFRKSVGLKTIDFGSGQTRSDSATKASKRGLAGEKIVEKMLVQHFGEEFVHVEKRWGDFKLRLDFFVYNPTLNFGVDVISAENKHSFTVNINNKIPRYTGFPFKLYYVILGPELTQNKLDSLVKNKRVFLISGNSSVVSPDQFEIEIRKYSRYHTV